MNKQRSKSERVKKTTRSKGIYEENTEVLQN